MTLKINNLIVGNGPPGVHFFHTGVRRRKYKLGQTKQNPSDGGLWPRGWGLLVTDRCVLNYHNRTGSFKMKRFEFFCSDPFIINLGNGQRGILRPVRHWTWW